MSFQQAPSWWITRDGSYLARALASCLPFPSVLAVAATRTQHAAPAMAVAFPILTGARLSSPVPRRIHTWLAVPTTAISPSAPPQSPGA